MRPLAHAECSLRMPHQLIRAMLQSLPDLQYILVHPGSQPTQACQALRVQVYGLCMGMFTGSVVNVSLYAYLTSTTPWEKVGLHSNTPWHVYISPFTAHLIDDAELADNSKSLAAATEVS